MDFNQRANAATPRLALYGVGRYGQEIARFAVRKGWKIVAAYNRASPKVGQDIGRLAGLNRDYGVVVQDCEGDHRPEFFRVVRAALGYIDEERERIALGLKAEKKTATIDHEKLP